MVQVLPRCKTLLALTVWLGVCVALVLVWLPFPTTGPPPPVTHPTFPPPPPQHPHRHHHHNNQAQPEALVEEPHSTPLDPRRHGQRREGLDVLARNPYFAHARNDEYDNYESNDDEVNDPDSSIRSGYYLRIHNDSEYGVSDRYDDKEYHYDESQEGDYTGGQYNVTPSNARLLIYNRIPKCASSTMQTILRKCSRRLGFKHVSSLVYDHHRLDKEGHKELVFNLTNSALDSRLSYDRHLYFTNFTEEGADRPVYINMVRHPVERFISSFYYRRSEERLNRVLGHHHLPLPSSNWLNRTMEECVLTGEAECSFVPGSEREMVLTYFCGHHQTCRQVGSKAALQLAKQVVSEEYSVVGVVDDMEVSLRLLEALVPCYLTGALQIYHNIKKKEVGMVNKNSHKPEVSQEVRDELHRRMAHDIDFYNFLKQRLYIQADTFLDT